MILLVLLLVQIILEHTLRLQDARLIEIFGIYCLFDCYLGVWLLREVKRYGRGAFVDVVEYIDQLLAGLVHSQLIEVVHF